jgi:hypothetical protein
MGPKADAIVVLGCKSSARLRRRVECGVRLYREGVARVLLLSGGGNGPEPEAELMLRVALAHRVPQAALLIEAHSRDTVDNARETALLLRAHGLRWCWSATARTCDAQHRCFASPGLRSSADPGCARRRCCGRSLRQSAKWRRCRSASFVPFSLGEKAGGDDLAFGRKSEADRWLRSSAISFDRDCGEGKARQ